MSRYVRKESPSHSPHPRPRFARPRASGYDEDAIFQDKIVYDVSVYDLDPVPTGLVDDEGVEIMRDDSLGYVGFIPLG